MRTAEDFVREYRERGYSDKRLRVIASLTREPLKSEILAILGDAPTGAAASAGGEDEARPANQASQAPHPSEETPEPVPSSEAVEPASVAAEPAVDSAEAAPAVQDAPQEEAEPPVSRLESALRSEKERADRAEADALRAQALARELNDAREALERAEERHAAQEAALAAARAEAKAARGRAAELEAALAGARAELETARAEAREALDRASELDQRLAQKDAAVATAEAECQEALDRATDLAHRLREQEAIVADLKRRLAGADDDAGGSVAAHGETGLRFIAPRPHVHLQRQVARYRLVAAAAVLVAVVLALGLAAREYLGGRDFSRAGERTGDQSRGPEAGTVAPGSGEIVAHTRSAVPSSADTDTPPAGARTPTVESERAAPAAPRVIIHEVKRGDTLGKLCKQYLRDDSRATIERVARENGLSDPGKIPVGMKLRITIPASD